MGNAATAKKGDPENGAYVINIFIYIQHGRHSAQSLSQLLMLLTMMLRNVKLQKLSRELLLFFVATLHVYAQWAARDR